MLASKLSEKYIKLLLCTYIFETGPNLDILGAWIAAAAAACSGVDEAIAALVDSLARCWYANECEDISIRLL
jgi:hypothetical protein